MKRIIPLALLCLSCSAFAEVPANVKLAEKEICRYVYLRTGKLQPCPVTLKIDSSLGAQEYRITADSITGGSDVGVLYGAYRYAELLGVRFEIDGDVIPDERLKELPVVKEEAGKPLFELRGLQPFHDFMEGPDWWNVDDYKAYLAQMAKLRMNFIGFHCYPRLGLPFDGQEPLVWTGVAGDFDANGHVKLSYPTAWANTHRRAWGNVPGDTDGFSCGAAQLFETSAYGAEVMRGFCPLPKSPEESNALFNRASDMFREVFAEAHRYGLTGWVGMELPLWIPNELRAKLKAQGKNPDALAVRKEIFEGVFHRAQAAYAADGFWFWTGERPDEAAKVREELLAAHEVMQKLPAPLQLGVCGWGDLAKHFPSLHATLPSNTVLSCINGYLGFDPVAGQFAGLGNRPRFAIPWMEDDTSMTTPQLWVGRVRKDAADARRYGCTGLMGIHWRTKVIAPNLAALAQAGWQTVDEHAPASDVISTEGPITHTRLFKARSLAATDFYRDWCAAQFGPAIAEQAEQIFSRMDGRLPRPACWAPCGSYGPSSGPGIVGDADPRPWETAAKDYAFVDEFAALRPQVKGAGNLERFDYWLGQFRYLQAMGKLRCSRSVFDQATDRAEKEPATISAALAARRQLVADWCAMMTYLLETVSTPGEMGTVANLELHTRLSGGYLTNFDARLEKVLGKPLPADCAIPGNYAGKSRLIVPTVRSVLTKDESLKLRIIALANEPVKSVTVHVRPLGKGEWKEIPATHIARAVFEAKLPAAADDFEYYVTDGSLTWPPTAPQLNQTIVITD